jgi:hypothetical protein
MKTSGPLAIDEIFQIMSGEAKSLPANARAVVQTVVENEAVKYAKEALVPKWYAWSLLGLFVSVNIGVAILVGAAFLLDAELLRAGKAISRLVTPEVVMALITGVTVQTAVAFLIVTKYFFEREKQIVATSPDKVPPGSTKTEP